jgi:predicted amidophosphoribosyltransferase
LGGIATAFAEAAVIDMLDISNKLLETSDLKSVLIECPSCKASLPIESRFCGVCGKRLEKA